MEIPKFIKKLIGRPEPKPETEEERLKREEEGRKMRILLNSIPPGNLHNPTILNSAPSSVGSSGIGGSNPLAGGSIVYPATGNDYHGLDKK